MSIVNTNTTTMPQSVYPMNEWGGPVLPPPPKPTSLSSRIKVFLAENVIFPFAWPIILFLLTGGKFLPWKELKELYQLVEHGDQHPIRKEDFYQDPSLLRQVYKLKSAQPFLQGGALEWQQRRGFCASTTMRCLVKSFSSIPTHLIPEQAPDGPMNPEHICKSLQAIGAQTAGDVNLETELFRLNDNVSYETFLEKLQTNLQDTSTRVAINYLRPALFGWPRPWYMWPIAPIDFFAGLFGGHFSFVLGILPSASKNRNASDPLVAVFDVNHLYGGTYLVPARRLYESIKAKDFFTRESRAMIFVTEQ